MTMDDPLRPRIVLQALPSPGGLLQLQRQGVLRLVNVSGVDLAEIYGKQALAPFRASTHLFADVFCHGRPVRGGVAWEAIDPALYLERAEDMGAREQLLGAVDAAHAALATDEPVCVFCSQGQSRSPLVAAAALFRLGQESLEQTLRRVSALQPRARFTDIGLAALRWSHERAHPPRAA